MEKPKRGKKNSRSDSDHQKTDQVRKTAAKAVGLSTDTLSKAKQVVEHGNKSFKYQTNAKSWRVCDNTISVDGNALRQS